MPTTIFDCRVVVTQDDDGFLTVGFAPVNAVTVNGMKALAGHFAYMTAINAIDGWDRAIEAVVAEAEVIRLRKQKAVPAAKSFPGW